VQVLQVLSGRAGFSIKNVDSMGENTLCKSSRRPKLEGTRLCCTVVRIQMTFFILGQKIELLAFEVSMERLLLIEKKFKQEREKRKLSKEAERVKFGNAEMPGSSELLRRDIADSTMDDGPPADPKENERRKRVLQSIAAIAGVRIQNKPDLRATNAEKFVLDWNPTVTWKDAVQAKNNCPKSNPHQWIERLIQEY